MSSHAVCWRSCSDSSPPCMLSSLVRLTSSRHLMSMQVGSCHGTLSKHQCNSDCKSHSSPAVSRSRPFSWRPHFPHLPALFNHINSHLVVAAKAPLRFSIIASILVTVWPGYDDTWTWSVLLPKITVISHTWIGRNARLPPFQGHARRP